MTNARSYGIARSRVAVGRAFVVLAGERFVAYLLARWTRAITALSVAFVIATVSRLGAFVLTFEFVATRRLFFLLPTAALLFDYFSALIRSKRKR